MKGPWEQYQSEETGPWSQYQNVAQEEPKEEPKEATASGEAIKSFKQMGSAYQTALGTFTGDPEAALRAGRERQQEYIKQYGQARGLEEFTKAYGENGILAAGAEALSQVPTALSGQAANLTAIVGGGRLGAMVGAPLGPAGAAVGATIGAISTQIIPFYQQNLEAQLRAQEERGEKPDLNRAKALAYAAVQSSAEIGGTALAFGKNLIGKIIGSKPAAEATETLVKAAKQSLLGAAGKGALRATGAEIPVEMAQTILQRHQAGESLTDADALDDYKNTIYSTVLVAGPLGAGAGPINRMQARGELSRQELLKNLQQEQEKKAETETTQAAPVDDVALEQKIADIEAAGTVPPVVKEEAAPPVAETTPPVAETTPPVVETTPPAPVVTTTQGDQNAAAQIDSTGAGVSTTSAGEPGGRPAAGVVGPDGAGVAVAGDTVQQTQAATTEQPAAVITEEQAIAEGLAQDRQQEAELDQALKDTEGQTLPKTTLPDIENFQEEYDLAREDLAAKDVTVPEWKNLKADEKDYLLSVLPTKPSAMDYTEALQKLAEYKQSTGRGAGYGGEKVTPTQQRIINGYNEARADAYKKYNVNFPQWDSLSPEAQQAYTGVVSSNAPIQQDAGLKAVQQVLQTQGVSIRSTEQQQLRQSEAAAQQRAQQEDEKRKAQEAEAMGKGEPLTDEMRAALARGDINGVLGILAQEANGVKTPQTNQTTEPFLSSLADTYGNITAGIYRYLARTLSTMRFNSAVITDTNNSVIQRLRAEGKLAEYDPKNDAFYFTPEGMDESTVLHEVVHAGTVKLINQYLTDPASLSPLQKDALDHLQKIYDFTKGRLGGKYKNAYENLYEFVGYALTDARFQGELANIQSRNLSKYSSMSELGVMVRNAWGELTRALANLYGLLTGKGKTLQVKPELVQGFSEGMSPSVRETFYENVGDLVDEQGLTETEVGEFIPGKQTEVKEKKQGYKISKKALLSREKGFEGNLLLEVSEIFNQILAVPEAGIDVSPLAASASGAATAKAPTQMGPSKPASLYDDDLRYMPEKFKTESLVTRIAKAVTPDWLVKKFQNDKHLSKKLENQLGLAGKLKMSGEDRNDSYTIVSLARGITKNLYNEKILPGVTKLETAFNELSKLTKLSNEKLVALIDKVSIAKHEPERRIVKFLKTAPLKPQMADVRQNIFKLLDSNTLSADQAARLRKKLDSIMFQVDQNGNPVIGPDGYPVVNTNNVTPLGNSPRDFKTTDVSHADYTVVDMDGASVKNINDEYNNHPQKALIDRVLAAQQEIINSSKELNQTANYVSDPVNNLINFYGWKNYVPMKARFEADGDFDPAHRGREEQENQYSFEGMDKVPDSPLLYVLSDGARAASRAGREGYTLSIKNNVLQGNIRGAVPGDVKNIPFDARDTELKKFKKASTIFHYNKDGSVDVITIKDPAVIDSLRRTYKDSNPLVDAMNIATGFVGKMHTRYNYAFAPMNFVRDALTNSFVLGADFGPGAAAEMIGAMAAKVGAQGGLYKAMRIANMYENGDVKGMRDYASKDAFAKTIVEYLLKGGATAYTSSIALKDQLQELNKELGRGKIIKTRDQLEKFVDVWNNMFEFSSRAAAYGVVKDRFMSQGMSDVDAAQRAVGYVKNLANFEQTGEYGKMMGGLFMFFRPAATGAVRAIEAVVPAFPGSLARAVAALPKSIRDDTQALARFEKAYAQKQQSARIMVTSLMGLGMMMYYMSAMMSPEDELGRNSVHSDNMKQWSRYARFHIPNEISEKLGMGKDVVFQMPWGFGLGAFAAAGAQIAAAEAGRGTLQEALKNIFTDIALDSFVPLPISKMDATDNPINFVIDSISPSIARPLLQFALNKDGLGRGIYNEPYRRMADAFGAGDRIPEAYKDAARYVFNEMGVDVNPNSLYFMSNSYFDGVGRVFETAYSALGLSGEKPDNIKRDSLLFGSFFGSKGNVDNREWGEIQSQLMKKQANLNGAKTDPEAYFKYMERNPMDEVLVKSYLKDVNGSLKKLQTEAKQIRMMPGLSPKERQEMLEPNRMMQSLIKSNLVEKYKMYGINP